MNNKQGEQRKTQRQEARDQAPQRVGGGDQPPPREHQPERKPSEIERREWRGSGVCGDGHTD